MELANWSSMWESVDRLDPGSFLRIKCASSEMDTRPKMQLHRHLSRRAFVERNALRSPGARLGVRKWGVMSEES